MPKVLLYTILLLMNHVIRGQAYSYIHYGIEDGLPTNYIYGVVEDHDGYIWAFTENGIAKFDGYKWKVFNQQNGMAGNDVIKAIVDNNGAIWTYNYNATNNAIYQDSVYNFDYSGPFRYFSDSYKLYHSSKIYNIDLINNNYISLSNPFDFGVCFKDSSFTYCIENKYIIKKYYNNKHVKTIRIPEYLEDHVKLHSKNFPIIKNRNGLHKILIYSDKLVLHELNEDTVQIIKYNEVGLRDSKQSSYLVDGDRIFVQLSSGLIILDKKLQIKNVIDYSNLTDQFDILRGFVDSDENLWIGTRSSGLLFIPKAYLKTKTYYTSRMQSESFKIIIKGWNDMILASTSNGHLFQIEQDSIMNIHDFSQIKNTSYISYMRMSPSDELYISYSGENFVIKKDLSITVQDDLHYLNDTIVRLSNQYKDIFFDKYHNYIWYIHSSGRIATDNAKKIHYYSNDVTKNVTQLENNTMVFLYKNKITLFKDGYQSELELDDISDISVLKELAADLWLIGTESSGMYTYQPSTHEIIKILDCRSVKNILIDKENIWIASYSGIYALDQNKFDIIWHLDKNDGLPSNEVHQVLILDDLVYAATSGGLAVTDLAKAQPSSPKDVFVQVSGLKVNGRSIDNLMNLSKGDKNISIHYSLLHYPSNGKINYRYKLSPIQEEWTTTIDREVEYYNLPPGDYTFDISATDIYGHQYYTDGTMKFNIPPPFWKTIWFYILMVGVVSGSIFYYIRYRENKQKNLNEIEKSINKKIADLQLSALRAQINPHFVFNALGAIQYFIQLHRAEEADAYLTRFAQLMRSYLDSSKEKLITVSNELKLLTLYTELEEVRFDNIFKTEISCNLRQPDDNYMPSMLVQPFVENAINHGLQSRKDGCGKLWINVDLINDDIVFQVIDNGIGRKQAGQAKRKGHKSRGMAIIKERIETLNSTESEYVSVQVADFDIKNEKFPGTKVTIIIENPKL